jgi:hypothetical protein
MSEDRNNNHRFKIRVSRKAGKTLFTTTTMQRDAARNLYELLAHKFSGYDGYTMTVIGVDPMSSWTTNFATSLEIKNDKA